MLASVRGLVRGSVFNTAGEPDMAAFASRWHGLLLPPPLCVTDPIAAFMVTVCEDPLLLLHLLDSLFGRYSSWRGRGSGRDAVYIHIWLTQLCLLPVV